MAAWRGRRPALVAHVDRALSDHPRLHDLFGPAPARWVFETHRRITALLDVALAARDESILLRALPKTYRAALLRGLSPAFFPVALQAAEGAVRDLLPWEYARELVPIFAWLRSITDTLLDAADQDAPPAPRAPARWRPVFDRFVAALEDGRHDECLAIGHRHSGSWEDLSGFTRHVVRPSVLQIERRWETGGITTADEHRATSLVALTLSVAYVECPMPPQDKGCAFVTAAPDVLHQASAWILSFHLEADGWDTRFIGADVSLSSFLDLLLDDKPEIIAFSVDRPENAGLATAVVRAVRGTDALSHLRVLITGRAYRQYRSLVDWTGADGAPASYDDAVRLARRWWDEEAP